MPLCKNTVNKLVYHFHYDGEWSAIEKIKHEFPEWTVNDGACSRCVNYFYSEIVIKQQILPAIGPHCSIKTILKNFSKVSNFSKAHALLYTFKTGSRNTEASSVQCQ